MRRENDGGVLLAKTPWVRGRGRALGMGGPGSRAEKHPRPEPGMSDLCGHLFGGARRAVVLVRVGFGLRGGGAGGLGDAGNEALGQLDRTLQGTAGVRATAGGCVEAD